MQQLKVIWLGRRPFSEVALRQEELRQRLIHGEGGAAETVFLLEHEPTITLGRRAKGEHLLVPTDILRSQGVAVEEASRGGDVTAHGPGQLVIYPVMRLRHGVVDFLCKVARAICAVTASYGVGAEFRRDPAGIWVGQDKLAACGIHIRRRVAIHGFALNVTAASRELFAPIVPCGLSGVRVTSLEDHANRPLGTIEELAQQLSEQLAQQFARELHFSIEPRYN